MKSNNEIMHNLLGTSQDVSLDDLKQISILVPIIDLKYFDNYISAVCPFGYPTCCSIYEGYWKDCTYFLDTTDNHTIMCLCNLACWFNGTDILETENTIMDLKMEAKVREIVNRADKTTEERRE